VEPALIGGLAAAVGVPVVFFLLAKIMPARHTEGVSYDIPFEELRKRYATWDRISTYAVIGFMAVLTCLLYLVFILLQSFCLSQLPPSAFVLSADHGLWLLPAFFLGLAGAAVPTHFLFSRMLGGRYREFLYYCNLRAGFDALRAYYWITFVIATPALLVIPLALDYYIRFAEDEIAISPFFSFGENRRPYSDVKEIRSVATFRAPNGNVVSNPYYQIVFEDGLIWSIRDGLQKKDTERDRAIMNFVSQRSGKSISRYNIAPE